MKVLFHHYFNKSGHKLHETSHLSTAVRSFALHKNRVCTLVNFRTIHPSNVLLLDLFMVSDSILDGGRGASTATIVGNVWILADFELL